MPVVLQAEAAECGLACLAMIAAHFGHSATLNEMRRRFSTSLKGATLKTLIDMSDLLGLTARPIRLELSEMSQVKVPAVLHWDLAHYVVLQRVRRNVAWIHDPAVGLRTLTLEEVGLHFTGVALEFTATERVEPRKKGERVRLSDFSTGTRGAWSSIGQLFVLALALQLFSLLSPMINQLVVDDVIGKGDSNLLNTIVVGLLGLSVITISVNLLQGYVSLYFGTQLSYQLTVNLLRHVMRLPVSWFERRHIGDVLSRFDSLKPVQNVFTTIVNTALLSGIMFSVSLLMMLIYSPTLAAIEITTVSIFFITRLIYYPFTRRLAVEGLHLSSRAQSIFLETLRGVRAFKVFGRERERINVWQNEQAAVINNTVRLTRIGLFGSAGNSVLASLRTVGIWYLGAKMIMAGKMTLGMLFAFQAYGSQFIGASESVVSVIFSLRTLTIHFERLADIMYSAPEDGVFRDARLGGEYRGGVEFRDISFRYAASEPWVIENVCLHISPGEFVCFVGPSGHGKTTILKIMLGFYDTEHGLALFDGAELRTLGLQNYRSQIGVVMQDDQLFSGTIADNISFFDPDFDQESVEAVAKSAQVHDDIIRLPMGYLSLVGDMGSVLSSGQKQRVLIARALYRSPKILFMDEGTANLDPENERKLMDVLRALKITRVFVAHREAAVSGADRVFEVRDGLVREVEKVLPDGFGAETEAVGVF